MEQQTEANKEKRGKLDGIEATIERKERKIDCFHR